MLHLAIPDEAIEPVVNGQVNALVIPGPGDTLNLPGFSRLMAKMAIETMAYRLLPDMAGVACIAEDVQLDLLRRHARYGETPRWPLNSRRIYPADSMWVEEGLVEEVQRVWESDILVTPAGEWYYIFCWLGIECTINLGGPEIEGYLGWLRNNDYVSPLYCEKNALLGKTAIARPDADLAP